MTKVEIISGNKRYTTVNIYNLNELSQYPCSFIPPKTKVTYFHGHIADEETYIITKGSGDFQVDDNCFPITEGLVIRVATGHS